MSDSKPETNRWKTRPHHWLIGFGTLVLILAMAIELFVNRPLLANARRIQIGHSEAEVREILGPPAVWQTRPITLTVSRSFYGPLQAWWDTDVVYRLGSLLPQWVPGRYRHMFSTADYPVEVCFDLDQKVTSIRMRHTVLTSTEPH